MIYRWPAGVTLGCWRTRLPVLRSGAVSVAPAVDTRIALGTVRTPWRVGRSGHSRGSALGAVALESGFETRPDRYHATAMNRIRELTNQPDDEEAPYGGVYVVETRFDNYRVAA